MAMKSKIGWMVLLVAVMSTSAWAVWDSNLWDPNGDPCLVFNLDFEIHTPTTTTDSVAGIVGTVDSNSQSPWDDVNGIRRTSANFDPNHDVGEDDPNDCNIIVFSSNKSKMALFNLGEPSNKLTWTLWFNGPDFGEGTMIRHASYHPVDLAAGRWWEIRTYQNSLQFFYKAGYVRIQTDPLWTLGISENAWHHAAIVIDRSAPENSKIYIDGVSVPVTTSLEYLGPDEYDPCDADIDLEDNKSPLQVGCGNTGFDGSHEFEGLLDEIRLYHRDLNAVEVSLLYQFNPDVNIPVVLEPLSGSKNVSIATGLKWARPSGEPQTVRFGEDPNLTDANVLTIEDGSISKVGNICSISNATLGGDLDVNTVYYWDVNSDGNLGPKWSFTTETGEVGDPIPYDGQRDIPDEPLHLLWTGSPSTDSYNVYFSDNWSDVNSRNVGVRVGTDIATSDIWVFPPPAPPHPVKGETYYWCVDSNFDGNFVQGDIWSFRVEAYLIVVNTSDFEDTYKSKDYDPLTLTVVGSPNGLRPTDPNTYTGVLGDDDTLIFKFDGDVNFTEYYDVIVIPLFYRDADSAIDTPEEEAEDNGHRRTPRPMAIEVTGGNIYFDSKLNASGLEAPATESRSSEARCGGHRGPFENDPVLEQGEPNKIEIYGPGYGATATEYFSGAGGGYGGEGGDCYRAGGGSGGDPYSYPQVPILLGGSAGGWSSNGGGGAGGGAVELSADGNIITFGPNAELLVNGGDAAAEPLSYGAGGGAGGSVRVITKGAFKNQGVIRADGGKGGTSDTEENNPGGGGGGGRIVIFHSTGPNDYNNAGQITTTGGPAGLYTGGTARPGTEAGDNGTVSDYNTNPAEALLTEPVDGAIYILEPGQTKVRVKWYPGFGATKNELYVTTNPLDWGDPCVTINASSQYGGTLRSEKFYDVNVVANKDYYWYVNTTYGSDVNSEVWSFHTAQLYDLIFNTGGSAVVYDGCSIDPCTCVLHDAAGWSTVATGSVDSDANVVVFNFSDFNYGAHNIIVLPDYNDDLVHRPLSIKVSGDVYFSGRMDISGDDSDSIGADVSPKARSGGHRGQNGWRDVPVSLYYTTYNDQPTGTRLGPYSSTSEKPYYVPTAKGYSVFGPGAAIIAPYKVGGGAGHGGIGGDCGRGYMSGIFSGGPAYGGKEVPIPFGGSAGGWGKVTPSGAGGGGVEIIADGNVAFGNYTEIYAEGGSVLIPAQYAASGGSGGSIKIVAKNGAFTLGSNCVISADGGDGGPCNEKLNNTSGGGAGGRVAIFYKTTCTGDMNQITANGGAKGLYQGDSYGEDGQDGTVLITGESNAYWKASAPTPRNGDEMVCASSGSVPLKWYSGYCPAGATDRPYWGTSLADLATNTHPVGGSVSATRGEHTSTSNLAVSAGQTYYWKVRTTSGATTVDSDVWKFDTVDWKCTLANKPEWDAYYDYDCVVNFKDFAYLAKFWLVRSEIEWGDGGSDGINGIQVFIDGRIWGDYSGGWLDFDGRTSCP